MYKFSDSEKYREGTVEKSDLLIEIRIKKK